MKPHPIASPLPGQLVDGRQLLVELFAPGSRPSLRWLEMQRIQSKAIPYIQLGRFVRYDVDKVREALARRNTFTPR